jgi:hypothetical protein
MTYASLLYISRIWFLPDDDDDDDDDDDQKRQKHVGDNNKQY